MNTTFAQRLFELRQKHGYSQEELAEALGVSRQAISNWERGATSPDTNNLVALARLYKVSVDELLGLEPSAEKALDEAASITQDNEALATQESIEGTNGSMLPSAIASPQASANADETDDDTSIASKLASLMHTQRAVTVLAAGAMVLAVAAILTAWNPSAETANNSGTTMYLPQSATETAQRAPLYSASSNDYQEYATGVIIGSSVSCKGVQYAIRGTGSYDVVEDKDAYFENGDFYTFLVTPDTQFIDVDGNPIDNKFSALKEGVVAQFTLEQNAQPESPCPTAKTVQFIEPSRNADGTVSDRPWLIRQPSLDVQLLLQSRQS